MDVTTNKLILDWPEYLELIRALGALIPEKKYSEIVGVSRGGLVPGVILSHQFSLPFRPVSVTAGSPTVFLGDDSLFVDDLVDSGETLSLCQCDIAVIYKKPTSIKEPTYWVDETDKWVVFPYEQD